MLKRLFTFRQKYRMRLHMQKFKKLEYFRNTFIDPSKNQAYIFLAADYGNLGDVAITHAHTLFLKKNTAYQVIEIPISQSLEGLWFVKRNIKKGDLVTTVGGGNMGETYNQIEYIRQLVFRFFPENKIISFPQTFDFSDTPSGQRILSQATTTYNRHKQLYLIGREEISFQRMQNHFESAEILLTPDIVLSLNESKPVVEREGAVICLRDDKEKILTDEDHQIIVDTMKINYKNVTFKDTHIGRDGLSKEDRMNELNKIWDTFRKSKLVITDRLHGMIFSYITNTPCLVLQNNNHKVKGTYQWIKDKGNCQLIEEFSKTNLQKALDIMTVKNEYVSLKELYRPLKEIL